MTFWNAPSTELKTSFRWRVYFGDNVPHWVCKRVTKPSIALKVSEHKYLGTQRFNFPTSVGWQPISLTLVDYFDLAETQDYYNPDTQLLKSTQIQINGLLKKFGYNNQTQDVNNIIFKDTAVGTFPKEGKRSSLRIYELDSNGIEREFWNIHNPIITSIKFGELSYDSDAATEITLEISYDWAELYALDQPEIKRQTNEANLEKKTNIENESKEKEIYFDEFVKRAENTSKEEKQKQLELSELQKSKFYLESLRKSFYVQNSPPFKSKDYEKTAEELRYLEDIDAQSKIANREIKSLQDNVKKLQDQAKIVDRELLLFNEKQKKDFIKEEENAKKKKAEEERVAAEKAAANDRRARQQAEIAKQSQSDVLGQSFASQEERVAEEERQVAAEVATQRAAIEEYRKKQEAIQRAAAEAKAASFPVGRGGSVGINDPNAPIIPKGASAVIITSKGTETIPAKK